MSKARASMGSRTTIDSLYIFTNESLLHKETIKPVTLTSFESFVASCNIPAAEADDVLTSLSTLDIGDYLPAENIRSDDPARGSDDIGDGTADSSGDDDGSDEDDEEEDGGDYVYIKNAEVPEGFNSVVMAEPPAYIPNEAIGNLYIMLCCDDLEWMLGKVVKMNRPTARLQLNVQWKEGDVAGQQAKLSDYFTVGGSESATPGKWFYVALARTGAESPSRRRVRGEAEEESKGGGGDGDDDNDDDDMEL